MADVRPAAYSARYRPSILALLGGGTQRSALWRWQFESNPRGIPFDPVLMLDARGRIAGFNGVMPVRVRFDGVERIACWSCDFHVHVAHRGSGVGRLVKEVLHGRYSLLLTFGVSDIAFSVLRRLGWHQATDVWRYRYIRRIGSVKDLARLSLQLGNRLRRLPTRSSSGACELVAKESSSLPSAEELDDLWGRVAGGYPRIVCRDHVYLAWRYEQCPAGGYRYLVLRDAGRLRALAVYRRHAGTARLVDLVAARQDTAARAVLLSSWLRCTAHAHQLQVVTSDRVLGRLLESKGFLRTRDKPRFLVRDGGEAPAVAQGWFLMAGDSDGEFLQAASEQELGSGAESQPTGDKAGKALQVHEVSPETLFADSAMWDDLIRRSDADPLFMGWAWQSTWWEIWQPALGLEPCLLGVYREANLVGLAPLFRYRQRHAVADTIELHFIGNAWNISPTVRTEYIDLIAEHGLRDDVTRAVEQHLANAVHWDVLVVCDHVGRDPLPGLAAAKGTSRLVRKTDDGWSVATDGCFADWLQSLGSSTRLKVYNRRRYLAAGSTLCFRCEPDFRKALAQLNAFHQKRWGKPCFSGESLDFHRRLLSRLDRPEAIRFTVLEIDGVVRSVLYDLRLAGRTYNLQAGFDEGFDPKVSLGTLHLGYAIEEAFSAPAVRAYDLLAGTGKNTDYKRHFHGHCVRFVTFQLVRKPTLRLVYGVYGMMPDSLRHQARRWFGRRGA
ncbi:GNAT family N-acetyltransferase [Methylonatrum kenyense]|uniref:GNAT family N-acetyltransferase n=1 Tax=Methylonatrum kenyense TaxID=455253 RepID=UPI0020C0A521|nr:GNAT family N-acetyltransferase [Methylonatrum kenyense]MCK8516779.1 GNAT family N-acetyltransferase [Methylonatrum kenyense]